jgi:hypothetical protein
LTECWSCRRGAHDCPSPHGLSDGAHHWWSGWPGAYCMGCFSDDPAEQCLADGCLCSCHEASEREYEEMVRREALGGV